MPTGENSFGDRLRRALASAGMSQADLAKLAGIAPSTISRWYGGNEPQPRTVAAVAKILAVDSDWLSTGRVSNAHPRNNAYSDGVPPAHARIREEHGGEASMESLREIIDLLESAGTEGVRRALARDLVEMATQISRTILDPE